jgi:thiol:disulfide interchange protein/DsbC/DsbD-like thiol-disulfide interchange protein
MTPPDIGDGANDTVDRSIPAFRSRQRLKRQNDRSGNARAGARVNGNHPANQPPREDMTPLPNSGQMSLVHVGMLILYVLGVIAILTVYFMLDSANAQDRPSGNAIAIALQAESDSPAPGGATAIAIAMTPQSEWHGYWQNGGDAGFGMSVRWTVPEGVEVGSLQYPVPGTLVIAGLMNHVYKQPYALIAPLTVSADVPAGTRLPIRGEANWLACTDVICVPERGTIAIDLVAGDGSIAAADRARFDRWRAALPQQLGQTARFERSGDVLRIAVPFPASAGLADPHLFIAEPRINQPAAEQRFFRAGDTLVIETTAGSDLPQSGGSFSGLLRIAQERGLAFAAAPGDVPAAEGEALMSRPDAIGGGAGATAASSGFDAGLFLLSLGGAVLGGLLLNIMPCVFPILSLKALSLARAGGEEREARAEGIGYTLGATFTCLALGAVLLLLRASGEAVGWAFQLQDPISVLLLTVLTATIAANLAGLFDFGQLGVGSRWGGGKGAKGGFATGALAAFVATPCTGPFLGAALGATLALPGWAALPIFGGLGFGLALPFLALALIPALRAKLPRPGAWMVTFQRWLAVPMALTALALVWLLAQQTGTSGWWAGAAALATVVLLCGWAGREQRASRAAHWPILLLAASILPLSTLLPEEGAPRAAQAPDMHGAEPWSEERLAALRAEGRPVFVNFTADWCVSCKVNEAAAINREETARAFAEGNVAVLVADWTNADAAIARELERHGRNSVPLYLWYPAAGGEPEILPQILTPDMLVSRTGTQ